jgi:EAL domain-containing protein (putative c-di-GMP-specific phosphodiesterase class I)
MRESIAAGLDPCNLICEITETAVMIDFARALEFVSALKELGCDLALDDFGTGFGSFTYLKHLPARYLKIDMEFVRDINEDPTDREIVRSIVGIAHTLGKETIAEGVENADVQQTLRELDVDYAQGFYIGSPAPIV